MNATAHKFGTLVAGGVLLCLAGMAHGQITTFGTNNDGLDGFVGNGEDQFDVTHSLTSDAVRYENSLNPGGLVNGSLLKEYTLDRTPGSSYVFTSIMTLVQGVPDDNARQGLILFADDDVVIGDSEGISAQLNYDKDTVTIAPGVNNGDFGAGSQDGFTGRTGTEWFGPELTFEVTVDFVGTDINLGYTLSDGTNSTSVGATVLAADYTGTYFGFGSRTRVRGDNPGVNDINQVADYQSFGVIPEPSTFALLACAVGIVTYIRRKRR